MRERACHRPRSWPSRSCVLALVVLLGVVLAHGGGADAGGQARSSSSRACRSALSARQAGALAAADEYLVASRRSRSSRTRRCSRRWCARSTRPGSATGTLAKAGRLRAGDTQNMSNYREGGRGIAVVAARRLDTYTPARATVRSWLGGLVWGPGSGAAPDVEPRRHDALVAARGAGWWRPPAPTRRRRRSRRSCT